MKENELRIGNLVQSYADIITVEYVDKRFIKGVFNRVDIYNTSIAVKNVNPIPLTEEWLLKFGFEKVEYSDERHGFGNEYNLKVNEDMFFNYSDDFSLCIYRSKESMKNEIGIIPEWDAIKHVHQLQNLYYSLTGKEII